MDDRISDTWGERTPYGAGETAMQLKWLRTRLKQAAPQALVVA
jgi:hypothetical protein